MTILQIRAVLLTAELGTISAAAKILNISQPNASNSIKLLEDEIGFSLFNRTSTGAILTKKGEKFIIHAREIASEHEKIYDIKNEDDIYQLRLGGVNYYTTIDPFLKLCAEHRNDKEADFRYFNVSVSEGIQELRNRNLDIVIAPVMKHQITGLKNECKNNNIVLKSICKIPAVVILRKDHPAALDGRCKNISQGSSVLKEYPYVAYRNLFEESGSTAYNDADFIQNAYIMYVDEVDLRLRLVAETNGFAFGARSSKGLLERYGLVSFPIKNISLEMFSLVRPSDTDRKEILDYINLLKKEIYFLLK